MALTVARGQLNDHPILHVDTVSGAGVPDHLPVHRLQGQGVHRDGVAAGCGLRRGPGGQVVDAARFSPDGVGVIGPERLHALRQGDAGEHPPGLRHGQQDALWGHEAAEGGEGGGRCKGAAGQAVAGVDCKHGQSLQPGQGRGGQWPGVSRAGGQRVGASLAACVAVDVGRRGGHRTGPADEPAVADQRHGLLGGQMDFNAGGGPVGFLYRGQQDQPLGPAEGIGFIVREAPAIIMDGYGQRAAVGVENHSRCLQPGVSGRGQCPGGEPGREGR